MAGQRSAKGGWGVEGCAGRVVKGNGERERESTRQHLDPELFPRRVTFCLV